MSPKSLEFVKNTGAKRSKRCCRSLPYDKFMHSRLLCFDVWSGISRVSSHFVLSWNCCNFIIIAVFFCPGPHAKTKGRASYIMGVSYGEITGFSLPHHTVWPNFHNKLKSSNIVYSGLSCCVYAKPIQTFCACTAAQVRRKGHSFCTLCVCQYISAVVTS